MACKTSTKRTKIILLTNKKKETVEKTRIINAISFVETTCIFLYFFVLRYTLRIDHIYKEQFVGFNMKQSTIDIYNLKVKFATYQNIQEGFLHYDKCFTESSQN